MLYLLVMKKKTKNFNMANFWQQNSTPTNFSVLIGSRGDGTVVRSQAQHFILIYK